MTDQSAMIDMTAAIVSAFVGNSTMRASELPELIATVHASLIGLTTPKAVEEPVPDLKPAVPVKKSITDDYLICLDDGKKFKSLKRHLQRAFGLTPDAYRAKWGLPRDYPMVAPGYAAKRSELAKATGLGNSRRSIAVPAPVELVAEPVAAKPAAVMPADPANDASAVARPRKAAAKRASAPEQVASEPVVQKPVKRRGRVKSAA